MHCNVICDVVLYYVYLLIPFSNTVKKSSQKPFDACLESVCKF